MIKQKPERDTAVTLNDWIDYIQSEYGAAPEHPWADEPEFAVFRHESNRKWFALFMTVARFRLGLPGEGDIAVVNLKADPRLIGSQREKPGFFPAYHMNKRSWNSIILGSDVPDEELCRMTLSSFALTDKKPKKTRRKSNALQPTDD